MAKKPGKESSVPLILALVFFVLTTITFGVLWYMQFSEQAAKDEVVKKATDAKSAASAEAADAKLEATIYRIFLGIDEEKDKETVASETKGKAKVAAKITQINEAVAKAAGKEDGKQHDELKIWTVESGTPGPPPAEGILLVIGKAITTRDAAVDGLKQATDNP